jgi:hypothetical protein
MWWRVRASVYSTWLTMLSWMDSTSFLRYVSAAVRAQEVGRRQHGERANPCQLPQRAGRLTKACTLLAEATRPVARLRAPNRPPLTHP